MASFDKAGNFSIETLNEIISAGVSSKLIYEGSICDSYPCLNDGVCIELFNQTSSEHGRAYRCMCGHMFHGHDCEIMIPPNNCSSIYPCTSDPLCFPHLPSVRCLPLLSNCTFNPCLNGGVCLLSANYQPSLHQRCICPSAFYGILCECKSNIRNKQNSVILVPSSLYKTSSFSPNNFLPASINNADQSEWSVLQSIFFFAALIILAATLLALCYGCNHSCYLLLPSFHKRSSSLSRRTTRSSAKYSHFPAIFRRLSEYEVGNQYFLEDDFFGCDDEDLVGGVQMFKEVANQSISDLSQRGSNYMEMKTKPCFMKVSSTAESFITYDAKSASNRHEHNLSATNNSEEQGPSTPVYI